MFFAVAGFFLTAAACMAVLLGLQDDAAGLMGFVGLGLAGIAFVNLQAGHLTAREQARTEAAIRGRMEAMVDALPDGWLVLGADRTVEAGPGTQLLLGGLRISRQDDLLNACTAEDARRLATAIERLRTQGEGFRLIVRLAQDGRILRTAGARGHGRVGAAPLDLLMLADMTEAMAPLERENADLTEARYRAVAEAAGLRTVLDVLPLPVWLRGQDTRIAWCNAAHAATLDVPVLTVLSEQRELVESADAGPALARTALENDIAQSQDHHTVVSGARRLLRITEAPQPLDTAPGGRVVVGYAMDLTETESLKAELERHLAAQAELLGQLGSAIAVFGADTRLHFYNQAYVSLWGLDEGWLGTHPTYGELLEDLRARRRLPEQSDFPRFKRAQLARFTSLIEPEEDLLHLPDGTTLRSLTALHPLGGLMTVLEDVTNALALETSYNALMAVQQETLDNLAEGIAVFGGDGRLKLSNPAFRRIWNLKPDDIEGEPHVIELLEKMRPLADAGGDWETTKGEMLADLLDRSERQGRLVRGDGSILEFACVPLPDGTVLTSYLDVTDTVRVEHALRERNAALETADRLKSEFIANVSYQLRTPLNAIMGFAEILTYEYYGPLNERQREYSKGILESSERLLALINDILDLATIEAGYMVLKRQPVHVQPMLATVVALTREWARKQNLTVILEAADNLGVIEVDEKRIKQTLFNLISNSIKFTPEGGRISLSAYRTDEELVIAVSDTGVGIPEQDHERVFGRFERTNLQTGQTGAGLGLPLVKSFIELHGGRVEITSEVGAGTRIACILPLDHRTVLPPVRRETYHPAAPATALPGP